MFLAALVLASAFGLALALAVGARLPLTDPSGTAYAEGIHPTEGEPMAKHRRARTVALGIILVGVAGSAIILCAGILAELANR